jgi:predicted PilT family ATPase
MGISIEVSPKITTLGKEIGFDKEETGAYLVFTFPEKLNERTANFYSGKEYIFSATIGKNNQIRVAKNSDVGKSILRALIRNELKVFI